MHVEQTYFSRLLAYRIETGVATKTCILGLVVGTIVYIDRYYLHMDFLVNKVWNEFLCS